MAVTLVRGRSDQTTKALVKQLEKYVAAHPGAEVDLYRQNSASVRVRVVDPAFRGKSRSERHKVVWPILRELPEEVLGELSMLVLLPPEEKDTSLVSLEFDDPRASRI